MPPRKPITIAKGLTSYFMENGYFIDAGGPMSYQALPATTQAAVEEESEGFAGLAVKGVGITEGLDKEEVHVYVTRGSTRELRGLPTEVDGTSIVVHNIGKVQVKPRAASVANNRGNVFMKGTRLACGSSCAPSGKRYSGTTGALVRSGTKLFAISNNHVFADCNHVPVGMPILSPSTSDARPVGRPPSIFARHSNIVELRSGVPSLVHPCHEDLAIAEITNPAEVSSWQGGNDGFDTPAAIATPLLSETPVKKVGRTTGLTHGILESTMLRLSIPYDADDFRALVWFEGVWTVRSANNDPFALGGDSGSLVVTEDGKEAVGILFATSSRGMIGFVVPIDRVIAAFGGLSLVSGHGT